MKAVSGCKQPAWHAGFEQSTTTSLFRQVEIVSMKTLPGLEAKYIFQIWVKNLEVKSSDDVLSVPSELERGNECQV